MGGRILKRNRVGGLDSSGEDIIINVLISRRTFTLRIGLMANSLSMQIPTTLARFRPKVPRPHRRSYDKERSPEDSRE